MDLGIKGKTALIGASSQGLGKSVALELAQEGVNVALCGRNADTLELAGREIMDNTDVGVHTVVGDLSTPEGVETILQSTVQTLGDIDILVTNTGGPPAGKFDEHSDEAWEQAYHMLLQSCVRLIRGSLPAMKRNKWGRIVCITSQAVKVPVDNLILSNSVRMSIVGLVLSLARELGPDNITVNNVMPGYTNTQRVENLIRKHPEFASAVTQIPLGRFGEPNEFAAAVAFLCSQRASYINGASLAVDGGWTGIL